MLLHWNRKGFDARYAKTNQEVHKGHVYMRWFSDIICN